VQISDSDRILKLYFTGGLKMEAHLYGSRANVLLADQEGCIQEAFRKGAPLQLPPPRDSAEPTTVEEFQLRWHEMQGELTKKLQRIFVRFNKDQCAEVAHMIEHCNPVMPDHVFEAAQTLHLQLLHAKGPLYMYQQPPTISTVSLVSRDNVEQITDINEGVRRFAQNLLSERAYRMQYEPLRKSIIRRLDKAQRTAERMKLEHQRPSRADEYERTAHILMASPRLPAGQSLREIEDVFHPGTKITVSLNPSIDSYQNAEKYYLRARKARISRDHLDTLIKAADANVASLKVELEQLHNVKTYKELKAFQKSNSKSSSTSGLPFKRYPLSSNYEVWVGRNAKESEALTLKHARPFDLWLHARGVSGAHTLLRLPKRDAIPSKFLIQQAAAIAAWHSKARTSNMAPVIVTPKKYVRKTRDAPVGEVSVLREDVVMVEPALP